MRADARNVYWGANHGGYECPLGGCPAGGPTKSGTSAGESMGSIRDARFVYGVDDAGIVYRAAK